MALTAYVDHYELAWRRAIRARLQLARVDARAQLIELGRSATFTAVDEFLLTNWYRLPEPVAELLWREKGRRDNALRPRPRRRLPKVQARSE